MSKPLTQGEKNRRANIRSLKALGVKNAKLRAVTAAANRAEHLARMEDRRIAAVAAKQDRIAVGIAKRDAHNACLRDWHKEMAQDLREFEKNAATDLAMLVSNVEGAHIFARIARLAHAYGATTINAIAKLEGLERMSVEGRVLEVIEQKLGLDHHGSLGGRVNRIEAHVANDNALPLAA